MRRWASSLRPSTVRQRLDGPNLAPRGSESFDASDRATGGRCFRRRRGESLYRPHASCWSDLYPNPGKASAPSLRLFPMFRSLRKRSPAAARRSPPPGAPLPRHVPDRCLPLCR
jgi:hypothetical protein